MPVTRCWRAGSGNQRRRHRGERCLDRTDERAGRLSRQLHRDARSRALARIAEVDVQCVLGHGVDRVAYRPEAANDGWQKIWDFYGRYLTS